MQRKCLNVICVCLYTGLAYAGTLTSCKKDRVSSRTPNHNTPASASSDEDSLKYLMYQTMQVSFLDGGRDDSYDLPTYYWYSQVPSLNPFGTAYANADDLLAAMIKYPVNPKTGGIIDRYSFLDRTGAVSGEIQGGVVDGVFSGIDNNGSLGMEATYAADDEGKSHLMVLFADKNSPAGLKGIRRGWEITAINGDTSVSYDGENGPNVINASKAIYSSGHAAFTFKKLDNTTVTYTLNAGHYAINPILFDSVYTWNNKKVGYFVFYTFSSVYDNGEVTPTKDILDREFDKFRTAGINDLIVDLRYNGGGAVSTAEYLDSAIAPAAANGKVMYQCFYNDQLSKNKSLLGLTSKVYFRGGGGLSLDHVFFIVSRSTASASELTLNNLKPYMPVTLVGDTTFGKPVGFIKFNLNDYDSTGKKKHLADLYAIDFATENANGAGGYYQGIPPDVAANDYTHVAWGSLEDDNLHKIFNFITTGRFARNAVHERMSDRSKYGIPIRGALPSKKFMGMVDYELSKKINERRMGK